MQAPSVGPAWQGVRGGTWAALCPGMRTSLTTLCLTLSSLALLGGCTAESAPAPAAPGDSGLDHQLTFAGPPAIAVGATAPIVVAHGGGDAAGNRVRLL